MLGGRSRKISLGRGGWACHPPFCASAGLTRARKREAGAFLDTLRRRKRGIRATLPRVSSLLVGDAAALICVIANHWYDKRKLFFFLFPLHFFRPNAAVV